MSSQPNGGGHLLRQSLNSARSLIGLQLVSRLVTFVLNQGLVRLASPQAYGTVAIQFEFIISTVLFLSREGIRNTLLRLWPHQTDGYKVSTYSNLATLPFFLGLPTTLITFTLYAISASEVTTSQPHFHLALSVYAVAALGELVSEPMHNRAMGQVCTDVRVRAEGLGIILKTITTYLTLLHDSHSRQPGGVALIAFALGQLTYSAAIFGVYMFQFPESNLLPTSLKRREAFGTDGRIFWSCLVEDFFDLDSLYLSVTMTSQLVVKHFLTEGDKFLVSYWSPLQDQGGYAIAVNYGSLIARIVFQPVEEMCRVYFSKALSGTTSGKHSTATTSLAALDQASVIISSLVSVQVAFSMLAVTFGSSYLPVVLQLLLPAQYLSTSAPQVLAAWVYYIPVLAFNGGLEAIYSSIATSRDLRAQGRWMMAFSIIYILSAATLYRVGFGDTSLVYANIANLTARIWYTATFVAVYFEKGKESHRFKLASVVPGWRFSGIVVLSILVISHNEARLHITDELERFGRRALFSTRVLGHVGLGGGLGAVCVGVWWMTEGKRLNTLVRIKTE